MKKIRIVMQNLKFGGAEKTLCTFLKNFDRDKYQVDLILHTKEGELLEEVPQDVKVSGIVPVDDGKFLHRAYRSLFFKCLNFFPLMVNFWLNLKFKTADVTVGYMEGIATNVASVFNGPRVAWVHTDVRKNPWSDVFFRNLHGQEKIYKKMEKIVFVSEGGKLAFQNKFKNIDQTKEIIVHNPIDRQFIKKQVQVKDSSFCQWNYTTKKTVRIITVSRLDVVKRVDLIVKSFFELQANSSINFSLTIIGEGSERKSLQKLAKKNDNVFFIGFKENPFPYVSNSSVFISTSKVESYPTAIIESLILGTPVLATKNAGSIEVLKKFPFFLLDENISYKQLETEILNTVKKINYMKSNAELLGRKFDIFEILKAYYQVFEEVSEIGR